MRTTPRELLVDIGWLAGIVDGEGSIHVKYYDKYPHFRYGMFLVNTNTELLDKCKRIIREIDYIDHGDGLIVGEKKYRNNIGTKPCYQLQVRRIGTIKCVLEKITPHLTEKRERAKNLLMELTRHKKNARWNKEKQARRD
jgi:hypothetical protein